jgi:RecF/RecN/SMC N terminal domain
VTLRQVPARRVQGIVFSVRPPKKSWKNIVNLSGGEKTLSSLSLVFALHHFKPTPLYFMDEIDAALDFKNVSIVAHYVKEQTRCAPRAWHRPHALLVVHCKQARWRCALAAAPRLCRLRLASEARTVCATACSCCVSEANAEPPARPTRRAMQERAVRGHQPAQQHV